MQSHRQTSQREGCSQRGTMTADQIIENNDRMFRELFGINVGLHDNKVERRFLDDESSFADRASWLDYHGIPAERRKPRNIINEANHSDECFRLIQASGVCCCQEE